MAGVDKMAPTESGTRFRSWRNLGNLFTYALFTVMILVGLILLVDAVFGDVLRQPPIVISTLNPDVTWELCPGDPLPIYNRVIVSEPTIATYQASVMYEAGLSNVFGTQVIYIGYHHPIPGTFDQSFPWTAPPLPPGLYIRSFSARGTDTDETTVFVLEDFRIGEDCL